MPGDVGDYNNYKIYVWCHNMCENKILHFDKDLYNAKINSYDIDKKIITQITTLALIIFTHVNLTYLQCIYKIIHTNNNLFICIVLISRHILNNYFALGKFIWRNEYYKL